jgi:ComF family protein
MTLPRIRLNDSDQWIFQSKFYGEVHFDFITAYLKFYKSGIAQNLLHRLKYQNQPNIGYVLGKWLGSELLSQKKKHLFDLIIPVPLHRKKVARRGYNQSAYFAEGISKATSVPYTTKVLSRTVMNETQTNKTRVERWKNVEGIFKVDKADAISGKRVLLVDDVITTGATVEACGLELKKGGAAAVSVAAIALAK